MEDPRAVEIVRVWAAAGKQQVSINTGLWNDPAIWGMMLVDLARHVANIFENSGRADKLAALERLRQGFDAEWNSPTDEPTGKIQHEPPQ
jgi:hypothetical protein